jgi:hypothetical protein
MRPGQTTKSAAAALAAIAMGGAPSEAPATPQPVTSDDPFSDLTIYDGDWTVHATHPWSGAPAGTAEHLQSRCRRFTLYFACEQTVNGKVQALIVYTAGETLGRFNTRTIAPNGLAGGRGDLTIDARRWTYLDKPPASLTGPWSRVENVIVGRDHIRFEEFQSADEGRTWVQTNGGTEERVRSQ